MDDTRTPKRVIMGTIDDKKLKAVQGKDGTLLLLGMQERLLGVRGWK